MPEERFLDTVLDWVGELADFSFELFVASAEFVVLCPDGVHGLGDFIDSIFIREDI